MKIRSNLFIFLALLVSTLTSKAGTVTNATANYGDGNVICYIYTFDAPIGGGTPSLNMGNDALPMDQYAPGSVSGWFYTDGDPTITLNNTINNDTGITWTGYVIDISMPHTFTISSPSVSNAGWSVFSVTQPGGGPFNGQIVLQGGTVPDGGLLNFSYQLTFGGTTSFTETLTPINVPEPATGSLLVVGGLLAGVVARRRNK